MPNTMMQLNSEPEISLEDCEKPSETADECILSDRLDFSQPTDEMIQFKLEPEISINDYGEQQLPVTTDELMKSATQDLNQHDTFEIMEFKLEPEISINDYGEQQQLPETTQSATQNFNQQQQTSEQRIISVIREENKSLRAEIAQMNGKLSWLTETVVGLRELVYKGTHGHDFERTDFNFPLRTEFDLSFIDKEIGETHTFKNECISEMRSLLGVKSLSKTLTNVMAVELILDFNVDGVHNKKGLRNYKFFFGALIDAIRQTDCSKPPIKLLQKAMHCVKNNACKKKSRTDQESKSKKAKEQE